jgi:hypothetical protein
MSNTSRRVFEELGRLLAEQDAAERELRRAPCGRRAELEAKLSGLCEAEGALGRAEMKASRPLPVTNCRPMALDGIKDRVGRGRNANTFSP